MIGQTVGHYKVLAKLGSGGMGVVYQAEDTQLGRLVALKFLPPELIQDEAAKKRLVHEARAVSSLQHQNICTIHEIRETDDGRMFICMDYYEGETLKDRLARGPLSVDEAIDVILQVAVGLAEAHGHGILHRDLKPANVVVTKQGVVKILDFGLARLAGQTKLTKTGRTVGTAAYMSPEQVKGEDLDARSDIFSLGVLFYELLTGASPFAAEYEAAVTHKILNVAPPSLRTAGVKLATQLEPVVGKMLAKEPGERFGSAQEVVAALSNLRPGSAARPARRRLRRLVVASAALTAIAAVSFALWWLFGRQAGVQAGEPRLAILYFENVTEPNDPQRLGEIATSLLITDLSESRYVTVVSSQRLYDILKNIGKEGVKVIDRDTATEVARKAGAGEMLVGNIVRIGENVELASQLIDVSSGVLRGSQRIRSAQGEDMFALVDRLSAEVKKDLELPAGAKLERDVRLADVTTHSAEAYRYYLEGLEHLNHYQTPAARASFERAVEADSNFAMAWIEIAHPRMWFDGDATRQQQRKALAEAVAHSERATRTEARYIAAIARWRSRDRAGSIALLEELAHEFPDEKRFYFDAGYLCRTSGDSQRAIRYLEKVIAIDPTDRLAYNSLAYSYQAIGDSDKKIWAVNQYIRLAPGDANPYDTQGDLYAFERQSAKAIASYQKAIEVDSTFGFSWNKLGFMYYLAMGDETRARECWERALKLDIGARAWARYYLALIPLYHGRGSESLEAMEPALAEAQREGGAGHFFREEHLYVEYLHAKKGDWQPAEAAFRRAREGTAFDREPWLLAFRIIFLAEIDVSRVEKELELLRTLENPDAATMYSLARAWVEMAHGRYDAADELVVNSFQVVLATGVASLRTGQWQAAVKKLEYCRKTCVWTDNVFPQQTVRVHFYLGQAYEGAGDKAKAIAEYETFIGFWKNADSCFIGEVDDARQRLGRLRGKAASG